MIIEDGGSVSSVNTEELWKDREEALRVEDEEGFEQDITLMEGLFDNPKKRYQKLLAVLDNHSSPVNCVRWNNIGTLFASAADDGTILLWEYFGEMFIKSAF
jgi:WD40 repeat protein